MTYYQHIDGGFYALIGFAKEAGTGTELAVYTHVWPFETAMYARPKTEFRSRFCPVSETALTAAMGTDNEQARLAVMQNKERKKVLAAGRKKALQQPRRVNVNLDALSIARAEQIGNGNVSAGIRQALRHCANIDS